MVQRSSAAFIESFSCDFNGIDEAKLRELTSAQFAQRGENLLIVGAVGSGKTDIAQTIMREARQLGKQCFYLCDAQHSDAALKALQLSWDDGAGHYKARFLPDLLDADVLIVEDAQRWLRVLPRIFTLLLCQRMAQGKSNILIMPTHGWHLAVGAGIYQGVRDSEWNIADLNDGADAMTQYWVEKLTRCPDVSFEMQLQMLGVGMLNWSDPRKKELFDMLSVPYTPEAQTLKTSFDLGLFAWCDQSLSEWMHRPGWKPSWNVLYTGEKNYRLHN